MGGVDQASRPLSVTNPPGRTKLGGRWEPRDEIEFLRAIIDTQNEIAAADLDVTSVIDVVAVRCLELTGADGTIVEFAEGDEMVYRAVSGTTAGRRGLRTQATDNLSGLAILRRELQRCDDSETDPRVNREACRELGLRSMLCVPLFHREIAVGVLKVISSSPNGFGQRESTMLQSLSSVVAASLAKATAYERRSREALLDPLTGLANRMLLRDRIAQVQARHLRTKSSLSLLYLDLDRFKNVNDELGHAAGDGVLRETARRLVSLVRGQDTVARLGGDEFVVLFEGGRDQAELLAARIRAAFDTAFDVEGSKADVGVSIGIATSEDPGEPADALLRRADEAMYRDKRAR
jgi:diguanylate cyclase (GGDEF)-like protein